jgi:hypothetical protein
MSPQVHVEDQHAAVVTSLRTHWIEARIAEQPKSTAPSQVESVARAALDTMLTRQYRVGPLPPAEVYHELLERVRRRVARQEPIHVTIGYAPLKNPHAVPHSGADWAEFFTITHLVSWHNKVQAVYEPGLKFRIVFDDATLVLANHADRGRMRAYMTSIGALVQALGYGQLFLPSFGHSRFAWLFHFGPYQLAAWRVRRWEQDPANREQLERMNEYASRNVVVPDELDEHTRDAYIREAAHRYRVYWEALQLSGFTRSKGRIVAMYLDGSQHHIKQSVALHLTSLAKGQVTQPWQGEGALLDNGRGRLEPFLLTQKRRPQHRVEYHDGLSLVPLPGFERIAIATPRDQPS